MALQLCFLVGAVLLFCLSLSRRPRTARDRHRLVLGAIALLMTGQIVMTVGWHLRARADVAEAVDALLVWDAKLASLPEERRFHRRVQLDTIESALGGMASWLALGMLAALSLAVRSFG
jgi:hypothetical protein